MSGKITINNWTDFWEQRPGFYETSAQQHINYFIRQSSLIWSYDRNDVILDVGCGSGELGVQLSADIGRYWGIDTSGAYVRAAKNSLSGRPNAFVQKLNPDDYFNFSFLPDKTFTKAICLSVVQYYQCVEEIEKLIEALKSVMIDGGLILLADVAVESSLISDVWGGLRGAAATGSLGLKLKSLVSAKFSSYGQTRKNLKLLNLTKGQAQKLLQLPGCRGKEVGAPLTLNFNRRHFLFQFV